ncbi:MAG: hypothetical protein Q4B90_06900 [Eubacteriales bacterium]|nr:hypothetical protein [Eubacteriales bacterium]
MKKVAAIVKGQKIYESDVEMCKKYLKRVYQRQRRAPITEQEEEQLKTQAQEMMIQMKIAHLKAKELKLDQFTKEQKEKLEEIAKRQWNQAYQECRTLLVKQNPKMTAEEAEKKAREYMAQRGFANSEPLAAAMMNQEVFSRVQEYTAQGIKVSAEEIRQMYDHLTARDEKIFAQNIPEYERVLARFGDVAYYVPQGYRFVTHIRLEGDEQKQNELKSLLYEKNGASKKEVDEEKAKKIQTEIVTSVQETAQKIKEEYEQGIPFEDLIEKYSADKKTGWNIHKDSIFWEKPVIEAVMAIQEKGEITDPIACSNGVYLFRYESDTPAGALPFNDPMQKKLQLILYRKKADDAFRKALKQWSEE